MTKRKTKTRARKGKPGSNPCIGGLCIPINPSDYVPEGWCYDGPTEDPTGLTLTEAAKLSPQFAKEIKAHCVTVPGCEPSKVRVRLNPAQADEVAEYAVKRWGSLSWRGPEDRDITWKQFARRIKATGDPGAKETAKVISRRTDRIRDFAVPLNPRPRKKQRRKKNPDAKQRVRNVCSLVEKALR